MSPALAGVLRSDGTPGSRHVAAIVLDLAARGYLRFEETTDSDRTQVRQRVVRGDRPPADLAPYEATVVEGLLGSKDSAAVAPAGRHRWAAQDAIYDSLAAEVS